jgi:hypothetical protein
MAVDRFGIITDTPTFTQLRTAGGDTNPVSLSEFYAANTRVIQAAFATRPGFGGAVPASSGPISVGLFRRKFFFKFTIDGGTSNVNFNVLTEAQAVGYVPSVHTLLAVIVVAGGTTLRATSTAGWALDCGSLHSQGASIHLINNGIIAGMGGAGANASVGPGAAGATGGGAVRIQANTTLFVTNNGTIAGGGGGGGAGGGDGKSDFGGGGGGGRVNGAGGTSSGGDAGQPGTLVAPGIGGQVVGSGDGGSGGDFAAGNPGGTNGTSGNPGGAGGAQGPRTQLNATGGGILTYIVSGTLLGPATAI